METEGIKMEPLRSLDDFLLESARFQLPNFSDLERWNKRVKENLIYYQSNYFFLAFLIFILVGIMNPGEMLLGMVAVGGMFGLWSYVSKNQRVAMDFKKNHPLICVVLVGVLAYALISLLGSVLIFFFGILLPLAAIFVHASLRLRNLKNKLTNSLDKLGVRRSPMKILLEELGMDLEGLKD